MRCYVIDLPAGLFASDCDIELYHGTIKEVREAVRHLAEKRGKHWVYANVDVREVDIPTDKASVIDMLNCGVAENTLVRNWITTPRGSLRPVPRINPQPTTSQEQA